MVRLKVFFKIFAILFSSTECLRQECGDILITTYTNQTVIDGYEDCTHATSLTVRKTENLHLKLSNLEVIKAREPINGMKKSLYYKHLVKIYLNKNLTWNDQTMPKLSRIEPLKESMNRSNTVAITWNYPFHYTEEIQKKLRKAGVMRHLIKNGPDNVCAFLNESLVGDENCTIIVGSIKIDGNFSMDSPVAKRVKNMRQLYGSILINQSSLTNLDLFRNLEKIRCHGTYCLGWAIQVVNNPYLQRNSQFYNLRYIWADTNVVHIENNIEWQFRPALKDNFYQMSNIQGNGKIIVNKNTCKLVGDHIAAGKITSSDISNCRMVEGDIVINEKTNLGQNLKNDLYSIEKLNGCLTIENIETMEILDFFVDLHEINCTKQRDALIIRNNKILHDLVLQVTRIHAHPDYNQVAMIGNDYLCSTHKDYFIESLEAVDGPPRVKLQNSKKGACQKYRSEPRPKIVLWVIMVLTVLLPPVVWLAMVVFEKVGEKQNLNHPV